MKDIEIHNASQGNLKNISVNIPRNKLVVLTGVSGSGKSTLAVDVLYQECQRQYLEAISFQGINKPKVEAVKNVSPAIVISQEEKNNNPRSSLGTVTDIYTDLRMIYEKLGTRTCPSCGARISSADCKEEIEKGNNEFIVYMYCHKCNHKMNKLTRSYYSFNTNEGACPKCKGLGKLLDVNLDKVINKNISLNSGAIIPWQHRYQEYQFNLIKKAINDIGLEVNLSIPFQNLDKRIKEIIINGSNKYEGLIKNLWRRYKEKEGNSKPLEEYFEYKPCPTCHGEKLNTLSASVLVNNKRITQLAKMTLEELYDWLIGLELKLDSPQKAAVFQYINDLKTKVKRIIKVGLGYLQINRETKTLSGGEKQRIKLAAILDSDLIGVIYILDEPTVGLHPQDTNGVIDVLKALRDKGNSVIVIEHDQDVIKAADYIIDLGPGAGKLGGHVIGQGSYGSILNNESSVTGNYFRHTLINKNRCCEKNKFLKLKKISIFNLKNVSVNFKLGCLNVVTGVSGAGKSSLVFRGLVNNYKQMINIENGNCFDSLILVKQTNLTTMKRSVIATYMGIYDEIRKMFGKIKYGEKNFSFNYGNGRCDNCKGLGVVTSNMLFFKDVEVTCPVCHGKRFKDEILTVKYKNYAINEILHLSILESIIVFENNKKIINILKFLVEVGLGYLELGQTLTTLSGGEKQRLKLAVELLNNKGKHNLYLIDEPTIGLHPIDVDNLMQLFEKIVDQGNTIIIIEHNLSVIKRADWIIDLGPGGGINGGKVIAMGTPEQLAKNKLSATGKYL